MATYRDIIEYVKEIGQVIFWFFIIASIFIPHSIDVWLDAGFSQ